RRARLPALLPAELSELLRPERPGRPGDHRLHLHAGDRLLRPPRRPVHPPGPLPQRGEARTGRQALRAGRVSESVPELRIDPLSGHKTIIAGDRSHRPGGEPHASIAPPRRAPFAPEDDPFAEGNEQRTPPELYALRSPNSEPNGPGWSVRVVANLYPA